jgi:hypothetical protein
MYLIFQRNYFNSTMNFFICIQALFLKLKKKIVLDKKKGHLRRKRK